MKKEFKKTALEVVKLKPVDILTTSCPIYCSDDTCSTDECTDEDF